MNLLECDTKIYFCTSHNLHVLLFFQKEQATIEYPYVLMSSMIKQFKFGDTKILFTRPLYIPQKFQKR